MKRFFDVLVLPVIAGLSLAVALASPAHAIDVALSALHDTMIFQNRVDNGAGGAPGFFAGTNSQPSIRRGLVSFDLSQVPAHATITSVQVRLKIGELAGTGMGGVGYQSPTIELHKLMVPWG